MDQDQWDHLRRQVNDDMLACQKHVDHLQLLMELVDIERILGGERLVVYYLAEQRVDFRQLVRDPGRRV